MHKNRKHKSDLIILFATLGLMALGLIVIYAIGPMRANVLNSTYGTDYDPNSFFLGQLRSVILSLAAFFLAFKVIPYKYLQKYAKPLMIAAILMSVILWVLAKAGSSLAKCELGECRWFNFGGLSFQPAELLKLAMVIYLADFLSRKREEGVVGKGFGVLLEALGVELFRFCDAAEGLRNAGVALFHGDAGVEGVERV